MRSQLFLLCFYLIAFAGASQSSFAPNITSYKPRDYNANPFIYDIVQNDQGLLYFANQRGLLEYDGERWKLIETNKSSEVNCIEILSDNTILLGTESGFGVVEKNRNGIPEYKDTTSLLDTLNEPIVDIVSNEKFFLIKSLTKVFAFTHDFRLLFFYSNSELGNGENLRSLSFVENQFLFQDPKKGIISFQDNVFKSIDNSEFFNNKIVKTISKFNGSIHIITRDDGVFEWRKDGTFKLVYYNDEIACIRSINVEDKYLALGTYSKGVLILDDHYRLVYHLDNENGLIDNGVRSNYLDHQNQLWIGTTNGISKIDILSSVVTFKNQLRGIVIEEVNAFNNNMIVSTLGGVFRIDSTMQVHRIEGINSDCYGLSNIDINGKEHFFISELYDVYKLNPDFSVEPVSHGGPYEVKQSPLDPNLLLVLHYNGIELMEFNNGKFERIKYIKNFSEGEPFNFQITKYGDVWIGTKPNDGVYHTTIESIKSSRPEFERFHTEEHLPEGPNYLMVHQGEVYSATEKGVYIFDEDQFQYTNRFGFFKENETPRLVHRINKTEDGTVWAVIIDSKKSTSEIGFSKIGESGEYEWNSKNFIDFSEYIIHSIYHKSDGTTWLGGSGEGLLKYSKNESVPLNTDIQAYIRSINVGDSSFYNGFSPLPKSFKYDYNPQTPVEFAFGNDFFKDEKRVTYSFYLEGYMSGWSKWTSISSKEFSLPEGEYIFKLKAKNSYGVVSDVISIEVTVYPPWYRTVWAYVSYLVILILLILLIIRLSLRRVKQQNIKLEQQVMQRTKEVTAQKAEAEKQRDIAKEQKLIVEEKNHEILDSINYAKKIQSAILPSDRVIKGFFKEHFILYKPKDIVAGDFYWLHSEELIDFKRQDKMNSVYLAAADCTGHGVPGAMVSVVCNNALNISVNEFKCKKPADILNKSRELVISEFGKSNTEIKDGMDIALCRFFFSPKLMIEYAGANNPLWVIRDTSNNNGFDIENSETKKVYKKPEDHSVQLLEIKADKQPIGKFITNDPFNNHTLEMKQGDQVYMFSDGYQDQFGKPDGKKDKSMGKKYKVARMRKLLLKNNHLSMSEQKKLLEKEFETWKGDLDQVDDVCIIGVRL